MPSLRCALVGSSGFAASMAGPALARSSAVELAGVLGSTPERGGALAAKLGVPTYRSLDALLADETLDAAWIAPHDALHVPFGIACAEAGLHVLVEKPMATTAADARLLRDAAERSGTVLRVGCHQRFRPAFRALHDIAGGGALGAVELARLHFAWEFSADRLVGNWRSAPASSGGAWVAKEFGAHLLDLLLWWTGPPAAMEGSILATRRWDVETDDTSAFLLRLGKGGIGVVDVSAAVHGRTSSFELYGTAGWVRGCDLWRGNGFIEHAGGTRTDFREEDVLAPYLAQLEDFAGAVAGEPSAGATGADGVAVLELVEAAKAQARRSGEPAMPASPRA